MILEKKVSHPLLESTIGHLNHVACIFAPMKHYMGRLYQALYRASSSNGFARLSCKESSDLETHLSFLAAAKRGLSLNNLVFRKPTMIYRSDASEFGIGGYSLVSGVAWRFELPLDCRLRTSLNSLEFLGCIISIWIDCFHSVIEPESCILSQTDSTSAMGWLRKSNFADRQDEFVQLSSARRLAAILLEANCCLFSQWFPGNYNSIADSLSRDFHINDGHLSNLLPSHFPHQAPFGLTILPVPPEIVSWLTCLLLSQPQKEPWSKEPTRSKFVLGVVSENISSTLESSMITTSISSPDLNGLRSSAHLVTQSEKADFVMDTVVKSSNLNQLEPPWTAYRRS